jgi:hypothetical protein
MCACADDLSCCATAREAIPSQPLLLGGFRKQRGKKKRKIGSPTACVIRTGECVSNVLLLRARVSMLCG